MQKQITNLQIYLLIIFTLCINFLGVFYPILRNDDPVLYATIAKNMVISGNWLDLIYEHKDWLDKPHLPFWVTGLSFKVFGIKSFAYILPGFLFHVLGAIFTYLLCAELFKNKQTALLAMLIYVSSLHLLISSIDVRAEAYLLGEIMGACYFWYKYDQTNKISFKYLILGGLFSACAVMTKGMFVLITISSGFLLMWVYQKKITKLCSLKWLLALMATLVFTFPEVYALYQQFDLHPEKVIFGKTGVSGIKWFFWGSQFGRFFNNGDIQASHVQSYYYLFFIHTFLWSFLPWSIFFIFAKFKSFNSLKSSSEFKSTSVNIFLLGAFIPTFVMFSLSKFQLDHYINIIIPFAAISCAKWYSDIQQYSLKKINWVFYLQIVIAVLLLVLVTGVIIYVLKGMSLVLALSINAVIFYLVIYAFKFDVINRALIISVLSINMVFVLIIQINQKYIKYDPGYLAAKIVNQYENYPIVDYHVNSVTLNFYAKQDYYKIVDIKDIKALPHPVYVFIRTSDLGVLDLNHIKYATIGHVSGTTIYELIASLMTPKKLEEHLVNYSILEIK